MGRSSSDVDNVLAYLDQFIENQQNVKVTNESRTSLQLSLVKSFLTINEHLKDVSSIKYFLADASIEELKVGETGLWTLSDDEEINHLMSASQFVEVRDIYLSPKNSKLEDFRLC